MTGKTKKAVAVVAVMLAACLALLELMRHEHRYKGPSHFPKATWVSAGSADPLSALETACWAGVHGDGKTMLASLTPDMQAPLQKAWAKAAKAQGITLEDFFASRAQGVFQWVLGFRVLDLQALNDHEALVHVYIQGLWHKATFKMRKVDGEWKVADVKWR